MAFAEQIKIIREEKGLTQKEFADLLLVSDRTVSRWERREVSPTAEEMTRIATILGCTISDLVGGDNNGYTAKNDRPAAARLRLQETRRNNILTDEELKQSLTEKNTYRMILVYIAMEFFALKSTPHGFLPAGLCVYFAFKNKRSTLLKVIVICMLLLTLFWAYCFMFGTPQWMIIYKVD